MARDCPPCSRKCPPCAKCSRQNCPKCKDCSPCPQTNCKDSSSSSSSTTGTLVNPAGIDPKTGVSFKIFVYDIPAEFHRELKQQQRRCVSDQYGTESRIHEDLLKSPIRTLDPAEADFFYVPIYGECFLFRENQQSGKDAMRNTNLWFRKALGIIVKDYPYWNRTQGRDHIWTFLGQGDPTSSRIGRETSKRAFF